MKAGSQLAAIPLSCSNQFDLVALLRRILQIGSFFRHDRPFYRADLQANAAINAGSKVNPVPVCPFFVFAWPFMDASNRAGINAIGNALAGIGQNRMRHSVLSSCSLLRNQQMSLIQLFLA